MIRNDSLFLHFAFIILAQNLPKRNKLLHIEICFVRVAVSTANICTFFHGSKTSIVIPAKKFIIAQTDFTTWCFLNLCFPCAEQ